MSDDQPFIPGAILELREIDQWVAYSRAKIPISPNGVAAKPNDRTTWGSLATMKMVRRVQSLPGVGFMISPEDPYVVVDLDDAIDAVTGLVCSWAWSIVEMLNSYTEYSPSGLGLHIWCRGDVPRDGARKKYTMDRDGFDGGVECYKAFRYMTVTGKWHQHTPATIEERTTELAAFWEHVGFDAHVEPSRSSAVDRDPDWEPPPVHDWLEAALQCISPDLGYMDWVKIGMAIRAELGDAGFAYWNDWSKGSAKYPGDERAWHKWQMLDSDRITIATVAWMAEKEGGFKLPQNLPELPPGYQDEADWARFINGGEAAIDDTEEAKGLDIIWEDYYDLYEDRSPVSSYMIEPRFLGDGDIGVIQGPPKSGKSMLCLDMFREFALGRTWLGILTPQRPLNIAYMQFEVKRDGLRERVQQTVLTDAEKAEIRGRLRISHRFVPQLTAGFIETVAETLLASFGKTIDILVLDPMANIFTGESENDNAEMSAFIRKLKYLQNTISPECALIIVHHTNKSDIATRTADPFNSGRGASAFRGAYDGCIHLDVDSGAAAKFAEDLLVGRVSFELRNGPKIKSTTVFLDPKKGRFDLFSVAKAKAVLGLEDGDDEDEAGEAGEGASDEAMMNHISAMLLAFSSNNFLYTISAFASEFAERMSMSKRTLVRQINRMATLQKIKFIRELEGFESLDKRSFGYMVVQGMRLENGSPVIPTHEIDLTTGKIKEIVRQEN